MEEPTNDEILGVLFSGMPEEDRCLMCSVAGDPSTVERWPGSPWRYGSRSHLNENRNNYVSVSAFGKDDRGAWRRKKDQFKGMYAIMVDDIGTKIDVARLPTELRPTLLVETSPGNYQATFKLTEPITDIDLADSLVKRMVEVLAPGGVDPGMLGVTRVMRLPGGINGKPKYIRDGEIWRCRVARWKPDVTMSFEDLARAFSLVKQARAYSEPLDAVAVDRKRSFELVLLAAKELGITKRAGRGWVDVLCPWFNEHTDKATTGSAIAFPAKPNGWFGGYRCHHGHCQNRNWNDLENWVVQKTIDRGFATRGHFKGE